MHLIGFHTHMAKKKIDLRIPALIRNGVQRHERSFFVIVGDKARNQLPNLHYLMLSANLKMNKSVLWAYKKQLLGFTSHRKKREAKIKKEIKRGTRDASDQDPFEAFISNQHIRYVYYKETEKILGNTYGMCILQDFEAMTPNLLARTIETVEGGGLVVILLKSMTSLRQLHTMAMDVHARYRTEAHGDVVARFNERFLLLLGGCPTCLVVDDELNVLPVSGGKNVTALAPEEGVRPAQAELLALRAQLAGVAPAGQLVEMAKTANQAQAVLTFVDAIAERGTSTVALTAGRGRGKLAALGLAVAAAVFHGYANIFVTLPLPENLKTFFEFVLKGFDAVGLVEHSDYDLVQLTDPQMHKAVVRVDVRQKHRQTIQYVAPGDSHVLGQAELVVIDEAAAIPLPVVKRLFGPHLVFMASTVNGYEGTGRLLSLKLIAQLRAQHSHTLREVALDEPIRYAPGDPVEAWLNRLLCLDAALPTARQGTPHPLECLLFAVNRDTLFSGHPVLELFLQRMMALYVAAHYKNTPNDLQLMSDAPAHQLYVLLAPLDGTRVPEPLCVVQLALEGEISRESVRRLLARGQRAGGDLIPWLVAQQFQDGEFASLSGARVVRIATSPDYAGMGYGLRAVRLLEDYFEGKITSISERPLGAAEPRSEPHEGLHEEIRPRALLPPLLLALDEQPPHRIDYLGVSFGLTMPLLRFWKRAGFRAVYLRQTANELTGEHTAVVLKVLAGRPAGWLAAFAQDFHKRFLSLLAYEFRAFPSAQALAIEEGAAASSAVARAELDTLFSPYDLKRLELYANNLVDYHVVLDMVPALAQLYFRRRTAVVLLSVQSAILLAVGLQHKLVDAVLAELGLAPLQGMAMFGKIVRKFLVFFRGLLQAGVDVPLADETVRHDTEEMARDLDAAGHEAVAELRTKQQELIGALDLGRYAIDKDVAEWDERAAHRAAASLGVVSLKSTRKKRSERAEDIAEHELKRAKNERKARR